MDKFEQIPNTNEENEQSQAEFEQVSSDTPQRNPNQMPPPPPYGQPPYGQPPYGQPPYDQQQPQYAQPPQGQPPQGMQAQQAQQRPPHPPHGRPPHPPHNVEDKAGCIVMLICFFMPVIGLLLYCLWKDFKPQSAKTCLICSLIPTILIVIWGIFSIVSLFLGVFAFGSSEVYYYSSLFIM